MSNINDTYFDGYYKAIWKTMIPPDLTEKEIAFMIPFFHLQEGSRVLDLMCGYGRHALALARKGMHVTAVDNLSEYIQELREISGKEDLPLKPVHAGILGFNTAEVFDLAICMGNSLNFFNRADTTALLVQTARQLKPGGHILVNSWSIAEIAFNHFREKTWSRVGELKFLADSKILFHPTRIETESITITPEGKTETKRGIDYIFSLNEMESIFTEAGLDMEEVFSIPGKKKFTAGEPRAYIIATKK